ncbi:MAG: hypothetical protein V1897_07750 [Pseudomonadota bacterium]
MSQTHQSLIMSLLLLIVIGCFTESQGGGVPQVCQPAAPSCYAPVPAPCGPAQPAACQNFPSQYRPVPPPVKVTSCQPRLVPLTYREEGPVRSIVINAVGLLKATIQLPFRAIEAVLPVNRSKPCAPVCGRPQPPVCGNPMPPTFCASPPIPACGVRPVACAPSAPCVGPLPRQAAPNCCGPQLPPQLVQEHRLPPVEPNNLLQGIINVPGAIVRDDRWFGDLFRDNPNGPYACGRPVRP